METNFVPVGLVRRVNGDLVVEGAGLAAMPDYAIMFAQVPDDGSRLLMQERVAIESLEAIPPTSIESASAFELAIAVIKASRRKLDVYVSSVGVLKTALEQSEAARFAQDDAIENIAAAARAEAFTQAAKFFTDAPFGKYEAHEIAAAIDGMKNPK